MLNRVLIFVVLASAGRTDDELIPWSDFVCKLIFRELDGGEIVNERQCYGSYITTKNEAGELSVKVLTHANCLKLSRRPEEIRRQIWFRCGGTAKKLRLDHIANTTEKYHLLVDGPIGPKFETIKHYSMAEVPLALQEEMAKEAEPISSKLGNIGDQCIDLLHDEAAEYENEDVTDVLVVGAISGMPLVCGRGRGEQYFVGDVLYFPTVAEERLHDEL